MFWGRLASGSDRRVAISSLPGPFPPGCVGSRWQPFGCPWMPRRYQFNFNSSVPDYNRSVSECPVISDADLLRLAREGDASALGLLFRRYELPVYRFLVGMLRNRDQAEDALQETFVQAIRHSDRINPDAFRGWLYTVAHRQAVLLKRKAKWLPETCVESNLLELNDRRELPDVIRERYTDALAAVDLLDHLPEGQQSVIRLRIFDGLRFQDVANDLNIPLGTALARMRTGLKKLRGLWEERYA